MNFIELPRDNVELLLLILLSCSVLLHCRVLLAELIQFLKSPESIGIELTHSTNGFHKCQLGIW